MSCPVQVSGRHRGRLGDLGQGRRDDAFGGTHYTWLNGPNPGYGFSVSPTADDNEEHQANIRSFLSMIDPRTGYIDQD